MGYAIYDKTTSLLKRWDGAAPDTGCEPTTEVSLTLAVFPDPRTLRWDGAQGTRPATAAEITAYDAAQVDARATSRITSDKDFQALVLCLIDAINVVRQNPTSVLAAITVAQAKQAFIDKRKILG